MIATDWGKIVNLASTLGLMAAPKRDAYTASKHGVVGLTRRSSSATRECGSTPVVPGVVRMPLTERYFQDLGTSGPGHGAICMPLDRRRPLEGGWRRLLAAPPATTAPCWKSWRGASWRCCSGG